MLLLVAVGTLFLTLVASNVLAAAMQGGGTSGLRGTNGDERLTGLDGREGIWGLDGDDELYGGGGRDVLIGGKGDDFIEAKDGEADLVACGSGTDVASVDPTDRVEDDCETLYPG
jgi:Ca2+-binding RTX toxin-like protein